MDDDWKCQICNVSAEDDFVCHKSSELHRFNFVLFEWNSYRKSLVQNRDGVKIEQRIHNRDISENKCTYNKKSGSFIIKLTSQEHMNLANGVILCLFTIENERKSDNVCLMKAVVLHPNYDDVITFSDEKNILQSQRVLELTPKQKYNITIHAKLKSSAVGSYKIPLAFLFQVHGDKKVDSFTFAREIVVVISDYNDVIEDEGKSPFKYGVWNKIQITIPPVVQQFSSNSYPIPDKYTKVLFSGLRDHENLSQNDYLNLDYIRNIFDPTFSRNREFAPKFPTEDNYKKFFHFLIWLDEVGQVLMLQRYNMSNVTMTVLDNDILELEVPGLAEKRPSLIAGDLVKIRVHEDHTVYKGVVKTINDKTIWIDKVHNDLVVYIKEYQDIELDVAFELGRLPFERKHKGVDDCCDRGMLKTLFPPSFLEHRCLGNNIRISDNKFLNQSILRNQEQKTAVLNIVNCTSQYAPYIVYGPPGTGKTITIVEAIVQVKENVPKSRILICAPANAACDMLVSKLVPHCNKTELIRVHASSRNWNEVPDDVKPYSNHDGKQYKNIMGKDLATFRIVVTTLVLVGKYSGHYTPDYVFIDEAAQAMEPEADIAIGLMTQGKHLILAGDPKQLGPQTSSKAAANLKLEVSLLERLMITNTLYQNGNVNFITMLKLNYRAHPVVLQVPNELFYESKLLAINSLPMNDPISTKCIYPRMQLGARKNIIREGVPTEFYAVIAKEQRQGKSPSYYNESEIQTTMKCVKALMSVTEAMVQKSDIGIVTPYIRQVQRLKQRLQQSDLSEVEVGTTEVFQGREKRIMIITTVRGQHSLLLFDKKYKLGFVSNEKRFNVALTRAKSKLIVIGNPLVLGTDKNWLRYIELCESRGSYFGPKYVRRTEAVRRDITQRLEGVAATKNSGRN